jgi:hypothetical protein
MVAKPPVKAKIPVVKPADDELPPWMTGGGTPVAPTPTTVAPTVIPTAPVAGPELPSWLTAPKANQAGYGQSPDILEARGKLNEAKVAAGLAGVTPERIAQIESEQGKPNKALELFGKAWGVSLPNSIGLPFTDKGSIKLPKGIAEFKPVEKLVGGPLDALGIGRRAILSTLIETGNALGAVRDKKTQGVYTEGTSGKPGWNWDDWKKQFDDKSLGYGKVFGNVVDPNSLWGKGRWVNRGLGLTGDIALDPVSYFNPAAGVERGAVLSATRAGGEAATAVAAREAADLVASKAAQEAADIAADTATTLAQKSAAQAAAADAARQAAAAAAAETAAKTAETASKTALSEAARFGERRVLGARSREELAQIARETAQAAVESGNKVVADVLTPEVIGEIATNGYTALRGPVAEVLGYKGGIRWGAGKAKWIIPYSDRVTGPLAKGLTAIRVGEGTDIPVGKVISRIVPSLSDATINVTQGIFRSPPGRAFLKGITPIGEGGLWGSEDILRMRTALRSGIYEGEKLSGEAADDFVKLLSMDRAYRQLFQEAGKDAMRLTEPFLNAAKKPGDIATYSRTISDLLETPGVGNRLLDPTLTAAEATAKVNAARAAVGLPAREAVTDAELNAARVFRESADEFYKRANHLHERQQLAQYGRTAAEVGADLETPGLIKPLSKNETWFPHVLTDIAQDQIAKNKMATGALTALGVDRTGAMAGTTLREIVEGSTWFGVKLTKEDIAGGVRRLNQIARQQGKLKYDIFVTDATEALTKYAQSWAKDSSYSEFLYRMAQASEGDGPWKQKGYGGELVQRSTEKVTGIKPPTKIKPLVNAIEDVLTPERVDLLSKFPAAKQELDTIMGEMEELTKLVRKGGADKGTKASTLFRDQIEYELNKLEQKILQLGTDTPVPFMYNATDISEAEATLQSLTNEARGLQLNIENANPDRWTRILPFYLDSADKFLALNAIDYPGLIASPEVRELLTNMKRLEDPLVARASELALGKVTRMFKTFVTATPGFHIRNGISNTFFMLSAGANPKTLLEGTDVYLAWTKFLQRTEKIGAEALGEGATRTGIKASGDIAFAETLFGPRTAAYQARAAELALAEKGSSALIEDFFKSAEFAALTKKRPGLDENVLKASLLNAPSSGGLSEEAFGGTRRTGIFGQEATGKIPFSGFKQPGGVRIESLGDLSYAIANMGKSKKSSIFGPFALAGNRKLGTTIEQWSRFALTYDGLLKGLTPEQAAARTAKYLIDYEDITRADQSTKGFIPFWKWTSRSFPLITESIWMNPNAYYKYSQLAGELKAQDKGAEQYVPSYWPGALKLPTSASSYLLPDFGFQKQEEQFGNFTDPASILASINPGLRAWFEARENVKFGTGGKQVYNKVFETDPAKAQAVYIARELFPQIKGVTKLINALVLPVLTAESIGAPLTNKWSIPMPLKSVRKAVADALQNNTQLGEYALVQVGKPRFVEEEQGFVTPAEAMQYLYAYLGVPFRQLQPYQQVAVINDITDNLNAEAARLKAQADKKLKENTKGSKLPDLGD